MLADGCYCAIDEGMVQPRCPRWCELIWAVFDMFTSYNLALAFIAAAIGFVLVEFLRTRTWE